MSIRPRIRLSWGFTLIEVMIVVVIIGVIAAIAIPSYRDYVDRGRRADGQSALMAAAQQMERCFTRNNSYQNCAVAGASPEGFYQIVRSGGATDFILTATSAQVRPPCNELTVNERGIRGPAGCWN